MSIKGDALRAQIPIAPQMYGDHAWLDEMHGDDGVNFGDAVFTFWPFVPFVDLPRLVNRAVLCNGFKDNVTREQKDDPAKLHTIESGVSGDWNDVACDEHALTNVDDCEMSIALEGRTRYDDKQTRILKAYYAKDPRPIFCRLEKLAEETSLTFTQVSTWFNNCCKREVVFRRQAASRQARAALAVARAGRSSRLTGS